LAAVVVVFYGVYGYFVESLVRIGFSVYQVLAVLAAIVVVMAIDIPMFRGARSTGTIRWGTIAPRSQYVLILLAVTFTWLMGLMGFARSGIRQHWHVYGVMRDNSVDAVTPAIGYAANMITVVTIAFFALVMFVFWLGGLAEKGKAGEEIFKTKGTCGICHRIGQKGTRAPDLAGVGARAAKTKPGMSARQYIIESLLQPGAYLVEGYPNIMPQVDKPPIGLNRSEL